MAIESGDLKGLRNKKKGETGSIWSVTNTAALSLASNQQLGGPVRFND